MSTLDDYISFHEARDAIRFSWNIVPKEKTQESHMAIPLGCLYTPLHQSSEIPRLQYPPLICSRDSCRAVINPFCQVDFVHKFWICTLCTNRNTFPKQYGGINEHQLPCELMEQSTTVDYQLPVCLINKQQLSGPIIFLLVIDTCLDSNELASLKLSIKSNFENLPNNALVGLITYGRNSLLHELVQSRAATSYCFHGSKSIESTLIKQVLSHVFHPSNITHTEHAQIDRGNLNTKIVDLNNRFLQPWEKCKDIFIGILDTLIQDPWPVTQGMRSIRCTGSALSLAVQFLEQTYPLCGSRIMLFAGGPCTIGPGQIVEPQLKSVIRCHKDIRDDNVPFLKKARTFYDSLASSAVENGHCIDVYACFLDQIGVHEMQNLFLRTGGYLVMADSFDTTIFSQSLSNILTKDSLNNFGFYLNSSLELKMSQGLDICGCIGNCEALSPKDSNISSKEIGVGKTNWWKLCSLDSKSTFCFVFENSKSEIQTQDFYFQFLTIYHMSSPGPAYLRVTTCTRPVSRESNSSLGVAHSFDQDAAAAMMARITADRLSLNDNPGDVMRWLDRTLIHLCKYVAHFQNDDSSSFRLPDNFALYPQFIFHLRRSQFLQYFNNSPDETVFYRYALDRENTINTCVMIQPVLYSYSLNQPPHPVLLDCSSIQPDVILFLDTYFHVLIFLGETIAEWCRQGYDKNPDYASFSEFIQVPVFEAQEIIKDRMPVPRYIYTESGGSQARFLMAKVNPSQTYTNLMEWQPRGGTTVLTDDISLQAFIDHLKKLVVTPS